MADLAVSIILIPGSVAEGVAYPGIIVQAQAKDAGDHFIQGETVTFTSSNTAIANFGGGSAIDTAVTDEAGWAGVNTLNATGACAAGDTVIITASIAGIAEEATLTCQ